MTYERNVSCRIAFERRLTGEPLVPVFLGMAEMLDSAPEAGAAVDTEVAIAAYSPAAVDSMRPSSTTAPRLGRGAHKLSQ